MVEPGAQYDHIGSKYDEYARTATLKRAECYTFFRMVGALEGKRVMDLACGFGFYTRLLKRRGAAQVTGIDISPEMIRLAHQQEQAEPLGITYQVGDAVTLPRWVPLIWSRRSICSPTRQARTSCGHVPSVYATSWRAGASSPTPTTQRSPSASQTARSRRHRAAPGARGGPVRLRGRVCHGSAVPRNDAIHIPKAETEAERFCQSVLVTGGTASR